MTQTVMNVAIFGASSAIAQAVARQYAARGAKLVLVGRNLEKLSAVQADVQARGAAQVEILAADLLATADHPALLAQAESRVGPLDLVLIAHGTLPDQQACAKAYATTFKAFEENLLSQVSLLTEIANLFEQRGRGTIAVISSVAGDRGRQSNYVYGAAKGGLTVFLAGLRNRLAPQGVRVLTIKPGFVDTPMTAHLKKGPLFASAETVGHGIVRAIDAGSNCVYLPWFWWPIMTVIGAVPEFIFKKLRL